MKIALTSVFVEDQDKALKFYTEVLGFRKKQDIPMGEHRWLSVVSPEAPEGPELVLEPNVNPAAKTYQRALREQGIPAASFQTKDIAADHKRLTGLGVTFKSAPTKAGPVTLAVFEDTCGNLIQMHQV